MTWVSEDEEEGSGLRSSHAGRGHWVMTAPSQGPSAVVLSLLVSALTPRPPGALLLLCEAAPSRVPPHVRWCACARAVRPWTHRVCALRAVSQSLPRLPRLGCPCWDGTRLPLPATVD